MLKAVIFDMDGVIINSEPLHYKAYQQMFKAVGIKVSNALYESFTGQSTIKICRTLCDTFNLNETPETLVALKRNYFDDYFNNDNTFALIDGVWDLIQNYHSNGLTLVLGSSASMPNIERIFERFNLNPYFKAKFSGADLKESKPHPEIFIKAAKSTGYNRNECMVIEDATNGIKAAKAAGIFCTAYNSEHSKNQDYSLADLIVENFNELYYEKIKNRFC
ncbi:MAG: HAD family hydrolase [Aestuariibaculum sp.]